MTTKIVICVVGFILGATHTSQAQEMLDPAPIVQQPSTLQPGLLATFATGGGTTGCNESRLASRYLVVPLPGGEGGTAEKISESGRYVMGTRADGTPVAWDLNSATLAPILLNRDVLRDINSNGQVAGPSYAPSPGGGGDDGQGHGAVWQLGPDLTPTDINDLLPENSEYVVTKCFDISIAGLIPGVGSKGGGPSRSVLLVPFDIDWNADNTPEPYPTESVGDRSAEEESAETVNEGAKTYVNDIDVNRDGVLGYAEFSGAPGACWPFDPMLIEAPFEYLPNAKFRFLYSASDPTVGGDLPVGDLRIWKKDGDKARSAADYIPPDKPLAPSELRLQPEQQQIRLYYEVVRWKESSEINVQFFPFGLQNEFIEIPIKLIPMNVPRMNQVPEEGL